MTRPGVSARDRIQIGLEVLSTKVSKATRKILVQLGSVVGRTTDTDNAEWYQHVGFVSLASEPEAGVQAAQTVTIKNGDADVVIASQDLRGLELAGDQKPGETFLYAGGKDGKAQARVLLKADGSVNLFTKQGNTASGAGVAVMISAAGEISLVTPSGAALLVQKDGAIKLFNADGGVQVGADGGLKLSSKAKVDISGPAIALGGLAAQPVALAAPTLAVIGILQAEIAAIAGALVAVANLPPLLPAHLTAAQVATSAVTAGVTALGLASPTVPTKRVSAD